VNRIARARRLTVATAAAVLALTGGCSAAEDERAPIASRSTTTSIDPMPDSSPDPEPEDTRMRIRLVTTEAQLTAALHDNPTARDFASLLPLTLTLRDYASTEKISDLPRELSTADAPPGADPTIGDIALYAPWGNLAIYYRDFHYSDGLVLLGRIDASHNELATLEGEVSFEPISAA
jgi:hypothetical protein